MTKRTTKNPSRRVQVEQQLAQFVAGLAVPDLSQEFPLVSITRVELTPDLKEGMVYVTAAANVPHDDLIKAMMKALPRWRSTLRPQLSLRYFPNLSFRYDEGQADILKIEALLDAAE